MVIEQFRIDEVKRLLARGKLSQRKIAKAVGISRGTVYYVATGRRRDHFDRILEEPIENSGPKTHCGGCGGMVSMPCRLCKGRALAILKKAIKKPQNQPDLKLSLELKPDHQERYEDVRRGRSRQEMILSFVS
jgi:hypothetical protein